jgi:hypothetical protein
MPRREASGLGQGTVMVFAVRGMNGFGVAEEEQVAHDGKLARNFPASPPAEAKPTPQFSQV